MNSCTRILTGALLAGVMDGCAAYSQVLINADGREAFCDSMGKGILGAAAAGESYTSCIDSRRAAGYLEVEKAGALGAVFNDQGVVLRISSGSPAADGGLKLGDQIVAVNGTAANSGKEIRALLFAPAGTTFALTVMREKTEQDLKFVSAAWSQINGFTRVKY